MLSFILLAGGKGSRAESSIPKQYLNIAGKPLLLHILDRINKIKEIDQVIICCENEYKNKINEMIHNHCPQLPYDLVEGGETRQQSVWNGLQACKRDTVLIHEAARPFVKADEFIKLINDKAENAIYGLDVPFTISKGENEIKGLLNRDELVNVQLPQKFNTIKLRKAFEKAIADRKEFTEDSSLFYTYQSDEVVKILKGSEYNVKVTYPIDFLIGETIYKEYILGQEAY